jgi:predicted RNase H-like HicB family nuclease
MSECHDKYSIRVRIEHLPEGVWLATSEDFPGLVVEAPTRDDLLEEVPIVAQKLIESYCERGDPLPPELLARAAATLPEVSEVEIAVAL